MTHAEIIKELSTRLEISQAEVKRLLHSSVSIMRDLLDKDLGMTLPGLGTFFVGENQRRRGFSPRIMKYLLLPPKRKIKFHPSTTIKDDLKFKRI
ncbi:HU family DNA-binding protein [bacterium]|nr:HU family DNA-binding protein [bacterium]